MLQKLQQEAREEFEKKFPSGFNYNPDELKSFQDSLISRTYNSAITDAKGVVVERHPKTNKNTPNATRHFCIGWNAARRESLANLNELQK